MNFEAIQTFVILAETKNFTRTAEMLYISQPTVTARIKALEQELGHALFERTNKNVELTPAGKSFFPYATQIYTKINESTIHMKNYATADNFVISAPTTCWDYGPLSASVIQYCRHNPNARIQFEHNISVNTLPRLANNEVDLGIVYVFSNNPAIEYVPYYEEELLLVSSPKLRVTQEDLVDKERAQRLRLIHPLYTNVISQLIAEALSMIPSYVSSDHPSLYCQLVKEGLGVGIIQRSIAEGAIQRGELVEVDCDYNRHPLLYKNYLAFRKESAHDLRGIIRWLTADAESIL